jgi:hypothetical protein
MQNDVKGGKRERHRIRESIDMVIRKVYDADRLGVRKDEMPFYSDSRFVYHRQRRVGRQSRALHCEAGASQIRFAVAAEKFPAEATWGNPPRTTGHVAEVNR